MRRERRLAFGEAADLYDRARPAYPAALADDVLAFARAGEGDRALEVGAGTGKATELFATRGLRVTALEPDREMAAAARLRLASHPTVEFVQSDFERWVPGGDPFRLVFSAQAWHWIQPAVGYRRARAALAEGGALAVFWNRPLWQEMPYRDELAQAYAAAAGSGFDSHPGPMHPGMRGSTHWMTDWDTELATAAGFEQPQPADYTWPARYTTAEYIELLQTHSDHMTLPADRLTALLDAVAGTIDAHGGVLELVYLTRTLMAHALPNSETG